MSARRRFGIREMTVPVVEVEETLCRLIEWVSSFELASIPPAEKTGRPYWGVREGGQVRVKRKIRGGYLLSPTWFGVESNLRAVDSRTLRIVTRPTHRALVSLVVGPVGALMGALGALEDIAWRVVLLTVLLFCWGGLLATCNRVVEREASLLLAELSGSCC